ncbi:Imm50 family immunity protein [Methylophilus flavus]|uniref:Imm50 family immunity protein n=1 Tax=Methylophilus flavus TaxID=640084 RepID=A0ABW3P832_9PROT
MSNPYQHITGSDQLIAALGEWPTFHDAEIVKFSMERSLPVEVGHNRAKLTIHVSQYASINEGTANYQMIVTKGMLANFVFASISDLELFDFNHQNVINSFTVSPVQTNDKATLLVEIESIWGLSGSFKCSAVELESVEVVKIEHQ